MQQATSANAATNANANNNAAKYRAQPGATERRMISRRNQLQHASPNVVGVHYRVGKRIGEGSFGVIYEGTNLIDNRPVAIKFEPRKSEAPQLRDEYRSYRILAGIEGIPNVYYFGQEGLYNVLCIDLLGPSLEDLFDMCRRRFSVKTVAMLAKNMLTRIQAVHESNLIYRDIKPDNFLIGRPHSPNANRVYMVDFGMAKQYRDPRTHQHIPYRERKSLSGTARYMSINTHLGREQSRRDDLEALGHVFMYFLRGSLPWQGLKAATNKQKYEKIGERKQHTGVRELCDGYPIEFATYLSTVRKYAFEETPDYNYLRGLFDTVLAKLGETNDGVYDWMLLNNGYGYAANSSVVSATRQEGARARNSGAYKTANPNHVSNQAMHSFDNNGQGPSTPNLDNSASNTPGKHSREQVNAADSKGANQQKPIPQTPADSKPGQQHQQQVNGKVNGLGHQTPDGAAAGNTARNGNGAAGGHNEKQGFMSKIISAFGCCSSSSV